MAGGGLVFGAALFFGVASAACFVGAKFLGWMTGE